MGRAWNIHLSQIYPTCPSATILVFSLTFTTSTTFSLDLVLSSSFAASYWVKSWACNSRAGEFMCTGPWNKSTGCLIFSLSESQGWNKHLAFHKVFFLRWQCTLGLISILWQSLPSGNQYVISTCISQHQLIFLHCSSRKPGRIYIDAYAHHHSDVQFDPVHGTNIQMEAELVEAWESFMWTNSINVHCNFCIK